MSDENTESNNPSCQTLEARLLKQRTLIIAANRGPIRVIKDEDGATQFKRAGGGLVTALIGMASQVEACWIANAASDADREWHSGSYSLDNDNHKIDVEFLCPDPDVYEGYYNVISNPLLWFLQHSMWDFVRAPTFDRSTWDAWNQGYLQMNLQFAEAIANRIGSNPLPALVMLQDYHLYLVPRFLRMKLRGQKRARILFFVHIPWPGPEDWGFLPPPIREAILQSLCGVDLLGFQTSADGLNFIRTCESFLPRARVNFRHGKVWYHNHVTHVRDFPISIDVRALKTLSETDDVKEYYQQFEKEYSSQQLILRVDRCEPSKNIVRGFQAFDLFLERYPKYHGKVRFLALLVPSRLSLEEYQTYLDEVMAAAGRINFKYGSSEWEPVRVLTGDDYPRAIAALKLYDVLLVNPIADGMNLVAKEGPIVNERDGVLILSERAGAAQQLGQGALVISPIDIYNTSEALNQALMMNAEERINRASMLRHVIERDDIQAWLCWQLRTIDELGL